MEYYINNSQLINFILTPDNYADYRVKVWGDSYENILGEAEEKVIKYIHQNNDKAIHIGERRNATSIKIRESFYLKLKAEKFGGNVKMSYL